MNVYQISVEPRQIPGSGIGNMASPRTFAVVTETLQDAMSIARGQVKNNEDITGVFELARDVIVDYSAQQSGGC